MSEGQLKLKAEDAEDVQVISAVLQDAIAPVCDMMFKPGDKNFIMIVHRFRSETKKGDGGDCFERICCALNLRGVEGVKTRGLDLADRDRMLELLAIMMEGKDMRLIFAGDTEIRLRLGDWSMFIEDFGEPWPTPCQPCHDSAA